MIGFPDELSNFKQKIFTFHNVRYFTFYSNGHLGLATHYISKSWLILNFLHYSVFIEVGYLFILCYIWKNSIFISYRSKKVAFPFFVSDIILGNFVSRGWGTCFIFYEFWVDEVWEDFEIFDHSFAENWGMYTRISANLAALFFFLF